MSGSDRTHGNCASQPEYETNWRSLIPAMVLERRRCCRVSGNRGFEFRDA